MKKLIVIVFLLIGNFSSIVSRYSRCSYTRKNRCVAGMILVKENPFYEKEEYHAKTADKTIKEKCKIRCEHLKEWTMEGAQFKIYDHRSPYSKEEINKGNYSYKCTKKKRFICNGKIDCYQCACKC